jgi:DNA polymerase-3 subunit epsilon
LIDDLRNDNLEGLTDYLGVDVHDRHNALGDSLMEAETLACLLPRLADKGIVTYGDAKAFSQKAKRILDGQKKSGWYDDFTQIEQGEKAS